MLTATPLPYISHRPTSIAPSFEEVPVVCRACERVHRVAAPALRAPGVVCPHCGTARATPARRVPVAALA